MSSGYGEFARLTATPLDKAVDKAVADVNDAYLRLLADHRCADHAQQMLNLDGSHSTVCGVCYRPVQA